MQSSSSVHLHQENLNVDELPGGAATVGTLGPNLAWRHYHRRQRACLDHQPLSSQSFITKQRMCIRMSWLLDTSCAASTLRKIGGIYSPRVERMHITVEHIDAGTECRVCRHEAAEMQAAIRQQLQEQQRRWRRRQWQWQWLQQQKQAHRPSTLSARSFGSSQSECS